MHVHHEARKALGVTTSVPLDHYFVHLVSPAGPLMYGFALFIVSNLGSRNIEKAPLAKSET
jgi:hypothetical protein